MNYDTTDLYKEYKNRKKKKLIFLIVLLTLLVLIFFFSIFIGASSLSFSETFYGIFGKGDDTSIRIVQKIRIPRVLSGLLCGAMLSLSGLIMQNSLDNPMASPSTLGISNASVLGANVAIIIVSGGVVDTANGTAWNSFNPYAVSIFAFIFSILTTLLILFLNRIRGFEPGTLVLTGVALSSLLTAITTLLQYFATDIQLSSAIYWSFGDLSRTGYDRILILFVVFIIGFVVTMFFSKHMNAMSLGDEQARTIGINTSVVRVVLLIVASLMTAICISFVGTIGFIGLVIPHILRKFIGNDNRILVPSSAIFGSIVLILSDDIARAILQGYSLPVGAITAILGAPFFLYIVFRYNRGKQSC